MSSGASLTVYWYPGCSTCAGARKWLDARGLAYELVHLVEAPPTAEQLGDLWTRSGQPLKRLFNTAGQSYRGGSFKDRLPSMSEEGQLAALAADGKLIKRPLVDAGERVLIGFREAEWAEALSVGESQ